MRSVISCRDAQVQRSHHMPKKKNRQAPTQVESRLPRGGAWTGLAAICMFVSWMVQNVVLSDFTAEFEQMRADQSFITAENGRAQQSVFEYQGERRRDCQGVSTPCPEANALMNFAMAYSNSMGPILEAAVRMNRNSAILRGQLDRFKKERDRLKTAVDQHSLDDVDRVTTDLMAWLPSVAPDAISEMQAGADDVEARQRLWTRVFQGTYIAASLAFAIAWLYSNGVLSSRRVAPIS